MENIKENIIPTILATIFILFLLFIFILFVTMIITGLFYPYEYEKSDIQIISIEPEKSSYRVVYVQDGIYHNILTKYVYETTEASFVRKKYKYNKLIGETGIVYEIYINENIPRIYSYDIE